MDDEAMVCPICKTRCLDVRWHVFVMHMEPDVKNSGSILVIRTCWCEQSLSYATFEDHFHEHGGVYSHYHACMIGVKP